MNEIITFRVKVGHPLREASLRGLIILLVLLFGYSFGALAQQEQDGLATLRVAEKAQIAQGEIIADRRENRDDNGRLAGGLLVQTDLPGLSFQANNGIIKQTTRQGEYLLFLTPDERKVTVYRQGFKPFDMILTDLGIGLRSGQVWKIGITGDVKIQEIPTNIVVTPSDATIRIDGEIKENTNPVTLALGQHLVQIQREQYGSIEDTIDVSAENNYFPFELQRVKPRAVTFVTKPTGAKIVLDGEDIGTSPTSRFKYPGQYNMRISLNDDYQVVEELITIGEQSRDTISVDLPKKTGTLTLNVEPSDAQIDLNGTIYSANNPIELIPGDYVMEVTAEGYKSQTEDFSISMAETMKRSIVLEEIVGDLAVSQTPRSAKVELRKDGRIIDEWTNLNLIENLRSGKYTVVVRAENYLTHTASVTIEEGVNNVSIALKPKDGFGNISINSYNWDADVTIDGPRNVKKKFSELPIIAESMPFGQYEMKIKKTGFKPISKKFRFNGSELGLNLKDDFKPKSKGASLVYMALIPGGGHFYMGRGGRGLLYLLGSGAAAGYTVAGISTLTTSAEEYETALENYENATSGFETKWDEVETAYNAKEDAKSQLVIGVSAFLGIRVLEFFDNLLFPSPSKQLRKVQVNSNGSKLSMKYNF